MDLALDRNICKALGKRQSMRGDTSQILLILSGVIVSLLFGAFLYREIFPEYKIYQKDYVALEEFRSTYTGQAPPSFQFGVKQIVIEREDNGPAVIDRCTSCHVALQIPYFSPTKIAHDLNGNIVRNSDGRPELIPNENFIWQKLDEKIAELRDQKVLEQLQSEGQKQEAAQRIELAAQYEALKSAHVGDYVYDVSKVLAMHPLMGNETYPFEYHPVEEYGCTSCHNGNGRGLVTDKAHGPVFDGQYEIEDLGPVPRFTELDPDNDPPFAHIFNHKPGESLVFQTEPIFVGSLIQAKCVQCHQTSASRLSQADTSVAEMAQLREERLKILSNAYQNEKQAVLDMLKLHQLIEDKGYGATLAQLESLQKEVTLPQLELEHLASQVKYLENASKGQPDEKIAQANTLAMLNRNLAEALGSASLVQAMISAYKAKGADVLGPFLKEHSADPQATGRLFAKGRALDANQKMAYNAQDAERSLEEISGNQSVKASLLSDVDQLTTDYQNGMELYISQACYACHRIAGFARGGVGPELTYAGNSYPWYLKRKLVWPQGDLATSTMPNMRFDHRELEDLMAFLLAQKGGNNSIGKTAYKSALLAWEAGKKMEWETPVAPAQMYDISSSMTIFATEGCAACHRLQGFESDVGFAVEKGPHTVNQLYEQQHWFRKLFPEVVHISQYDEELPGSDIVAYIEKHAQEIDERIVSDVRQNGLLEKIDASHPGVIESYYSPFYYASRAKDHEYKALIEKEKDPERKDKFIAEWGDWKNRVHRVLMMYVQLYGLGRLIGPHLNWSGIYRTDEWLMEHFRNPSSHVPRSLMPVFPFDDSKFYALTYMLDQLAVRNRDVLRQVWTEHGFDPSEAFNMLCAQCHGIDRVGNGAIAEWIYPIPKNLHNADFLRNLTKEKAIYSLTHGVKGTPMPPWGEAAPYKPAAVEKVSHQIPVMNTSEIQYLVNWLFSSLPGGEVIRESADVPKWQYTPQDVLDELKKEGGELLPESPQQPVQSKEGPPSNSDGLKKEVSTLSYLPDGAGLYAALQPELPPAKQKKENEDVNAIFTRIDQPTDTGEESYYIRKQYYTPQNIEAGKEFFLANCAVCHGNEADGNSLRAGVMQEAKPRILTNLDWIQSRDDLRLLRSIKYGVPGTAMTPWGDFTNSLQRLQLVIFIRSLSLQQERRDNLTTALFQVYENAQFIVENARIENSQEMEKLRKEQENLEQQAEESKRKVADNQGALKNALDIYQKILVLEQKLGVLKEEDKKYLDLEASLKEEKNIYFNLGVSLISKDVSDGLFQNYLEIIRLNGSRYADADHHLKFQQDEKGDEKIRSYRQKIVDALNQQISQLEKQMEVIEGKIYSAQRVIELQSKQVEIDAYKKLRDKLITDTEEALRLVAKQRALVQAIQVN